MTTGVATGACLYLLAVAGACLFIRAAHPAVPFATALTWQALSFGAWIPVAWLFSRLIRPGRSDRTIIVRAIALGLVAIPLQAVVTILLDAGAFPTTDRPLVGRWLARLPVSAALYTGVMAVVAAVAWRARAAAERRRAEDMQQALAAAKAAAASVSARVGALATPMLVSVGNRQVPIDATLVEWFGSAANYVVVNWDGTEGLIRRTLRSLEEDLDPAIFARCHRSAIVNLAMVRHATSLADRGA